MARGKKNKVVVADELATVDDASLQKIVDDAREQIISIKEQEFKELHDLTQSELEEIKSSETAPVLLIDLNEPVLEENETAKLVDTPEVIDVLPDTAELEAELLIEKEVDETVKPSIIKYREDGISFYKLPD